MTRYYVSKLAWSLLGVALGLHLPDVDSRLQRLAPGLFLHRSILTHGLLISLLLYLWLRKRAGNAPSLRCFAVGLSLAFAVHLCFDFFPRGWTGFALIHVPVYGRTTALFSQAWILFSVLACLYLALLLARNVFELALGVVNLVLSFWASAVGDDGPLLPASILLALATGAVLLARRFYVTQARRS